MYYVYGINSMGSVWYVSTKDTRGAHLWSGAPKELRATFTKEGAQAEVKRLDEIYRFSSTRHHMEGTEGVIAW